jgi:putative hydrolase
LVLGRTVIRLTTRLWNWKNIEINNHSFTARAGSLESCSEFAARCREFKVNIICGSDANISFDIGKFDKVYQLIEGTDTPEDLVMNVSTEKFIRYIENDKGNKK